MNFTELTDLATGYWRSAALNAAVELKLFEKLPCRSEGFEADLFDALAGLKLVSKTSDGGYDFHPESRHFLDPASPACLLGAFRYNVDLYPTWAKLAETIRTEKPALSPQTHLGMDPQRTRRFVLGMDSRAAGLAPELIPALGAMNGTLLDLACGGGTFSRILAKQNSGLSVTQFDLPDVLAVAEELAGSGSGIRFVPGDYRNDPLPGTFDHVLYSGALHQENPETALKLMRTIRAAVKPGGAAYIFDLMTDASGTSPLFARLFSLNMRLTSQYGRVFTVEQAADLLRTAGFAKVESRFMPTVPYALIRAEG